MPAPVITITGKGALTAGRNYTLSCAAAAVVKGLVDNAMLNISWIDSNGDSLEPGAQTVNTSSLEFEPLLLSHGGRYTCNASITIPALSVVKRSFENHDVIIEGINHIRPN